MDPVGFGGGNESPAPESQPDQQSLKNVFLSEVDPNDRPILEKYVDKWDAGATKKFQEYAEKLKGYEALGPVEQLQQLHAFGKAFNDNPEQIFRAMYDQFAEVWGDDFEKNLTALLELEQEMSDDQNLDQGGNEGEPNEDQVWRQNIEGSLEEFNEWKQQQEEAARFEQENRQLDAVLQAMQTRFGDFDREYVLSRLAVHGNPEQAFKEFQGMVGKFGGKVAPRQAPMSLGGQGGVPSQQINASKLRGNDRKALVAELLKGNG